MPIRRSFGRQESAESSALLISTVDDYAASTSTPTVSDLKTENDEGTPTTVSSDQFSFDRRLCRPMAAVHINNTDPDLQEQRRSKRRPPNLTPDSKAQSKINRQPGGRRSEVRQIENVSALDERNSRGRAPLRNLEAGTRSTINDHLLKRPLRRSSTSNSQRQQLSAYGKSQPNLARVFTRKSGFNYIFDQVSATTEDSPDESDNSANSLQSDIERFESLYRRVRKKLKRGERDQSVESTDSEMSEESQKEERKFGSRKLRRWAFWFIVAFLAALTIKDVVELISEYSGDPKQSDINVVFNDTMTMPNITFCMMRNQAYSHFNLSVDENWDQQIDENLGNLTDRDSFLKNKWDYRMSVEGYEVISSLSSMERETESIHGTVHSITKFRTVPRLEGKRVMIKKWLSAIEERNVTFEEFTQKVGAEIVRPSMQRFQRLTYNEDLTIPTRFRTSWISEKQFCFQPWSPSPDYTKIEDQGRFFTMSLSHNGESLNNKSVGCMSVDFHGRPSSLNRFMEGKGRTRDGFDDELCMGQYHEVVVEVRAKYEMLENDEPGTHCREQKEGEDTEFDCLSRCRMDMLREWCKCTPLTLGYLMRSPEEELKKHPHCDYTKCILDVQSRNYTDIECQKNCHRDCTQIRYLVVHKTQGRLLRPDMTVMELQWGSFEYLSMKQDWVWSVTTFIAALGGSIGLWLGLSILSLIQGGTYLYSYLTDTVIKKKIRKRHPSVAPMTTKTEEETKNSTGLAANPFQTPFKPKTSRAQAFTPPPAYNEERKPSINVQVV